ncbi:hypothetical protein F2Q69_00052021 [Brassica cretica]|uniref:Uncharacterized protein n=1 Tax=Brassica cretica TaxID=69181 RepID=A0A8S9N3A8_BRACR|nr:hypothetical protein F2Q69_00052021 [Brassica cretica]
MKCFKVLLDAERKMANKVERKKKTTSHHASTSGKTKRSSRLSNKCDAVVSVRKKHTTTEPNLTEPKTKMAATEISDTQNRDAAARRDNEI